MNTENILKVADAIEAHSIPWLGFNMSSWYADGASGWGKDLSGHNCGTVACIAGWASAVELGEAAIADALQQARDEGDALHSVDLLGDPQAFLGITERQAQELFHPEDISRPITPDQAVRTLRHLAATNIVNWSL